MRTEWTTTDRILYGVMCAGIAVWGIAQFIEACRSRPKVKMVVLAVPVGGKNGEEDKATGKTD